MKEVKLPFGRTPDGRMVSVEAVQRGLACDCICPACGAGLVAAKGEIYQHHFRHHVERAECIAARETAIHQFAKQIICEKLELRLPDPLGVMIRATMEHRLGDIVPDVYAKYDSGEMVAVEIWVAHQVPETKVRVYNKLRLAAVEIDLRSYRFADKAEAEWETAVLYEAERSWLSPPETIRKQREEERRRWLAMQRQRLSTFRARMKEAERERVAAEAALRTMEAAESALAELERQAAAVLETKEREKRKQLAVIRELERLQLAEERAKEAEFRRVAQARLRRERCCPDLQELVRVHGGYDRITPEAWEAFDRDMQTWRARVAAGDFHRPPYCDVPPEDDWQSGRSEQWMSAA